MKRRNFLLGLTLSPSLIGRVLGQTYVVPEVTLSRSTPNTDHSFLLRCIAEVETGNNDSKVGRHGERSRYQIREDVWRQHNGFLVDSAVARHHFLLYCQQQEAFLCASQHLRWLDSSLIGTSPMLERDMRPYCLAWCWNGGLTSWLSRARSVKLNNYAVRVQNLYDSPDFRARVAKEPV